MLPTTLFSSGMPWRSGHGVSMKIPLLIENSIRGIMFTPSHPKGVFSMHRHMYTYATTCRCCTRFTRSKWLWLRGQRRSDGYRLVVKHTVGNNLCMIDSVTVRCMVTLYILLIICPSLPLLLSLSLSLSPPRLSFSPPKPLPTNADIVVDNCAICRNHIMDLCECQPSMMCPTCIYIHCNTCTMYIHTYS